MTLDCPRCGERIIDTNPFDWADHMSPEEFSANLRRLIEAHDDACKPRRTKPAPEDAKRRRSWWAFEIGVVAIWAVFSVFNYIANGYAAGLAWTTGAVVLAFKIGEKIKSFQAGYLRGRAETAVGMPLMPVINVHPADRWRRPKEWDDDEEPAGKETS